MTGEFVLLLLNQYQACFQGHPVVSCAIPFRKREGKQQVRLQKNLSSYHNKRAAVYKIRTCKLDLEREIVTGR